MSFDALPSDVVLTIAAKLAKPYSICSVCKRFFLIGKENDHFLLSPLLKKCDAILSLFLNKSSFLTSSMIDAAHQDKNAVLELKIKKAMIDDLNLLLCITNLLSLKILKKEVFFLLARETLHGKAESVRSWLEQNKEEIAKISSYIPLQKFGLSEVPKELSFFTKAKLFLSGR